MTWFVASLRDDDTHLGEEAADGTQSQRHLTRRDARRR